MGENTWQIVAMGIALNMKIRTGVCNKSLKSTFTVLCKPYKLMILCNNIGFVVVIWCDKTLNYWFMVCIIRFF